MDDDDLYLGIGTVTGISGRPSRKKKQPIGFVHHGTPGLGINDTSKKGARSVRTDGRAKLSRSIPNGRRGKSRARPRA